MTFQFPVSYKKRTACFYYSSDVHTSRNATQIIHCVSHDHNTIISQAWTRIVFTMLHLNRTLTSGTKCLHKDNTVSDSYPCWVPTKILKHAHTHIHTIPVD